MYRVLYIDDSTDAGTDRFRSFADALGPNVIVDFVGPHLTSDGSTPSSRWDLLVADLRGFEALQRSFVDRLVESNPDTALMFLTEKRDQAAADASLHHGAIDCVSWRRRYGTLAKTVRRTLSRLAVTRRAIASMNGRIEELDVTLAIDRSPQCTQSLARYTLRHIARMDVCGLPNQFRAIRAFEETLEKLLRSGAATREPAWVPLSRDSGATRKLRSGEDRSIRRESDPAFGHVRIHLSSSGLRFTLRTDGPLTLRVHDFQSVSPDRAVSPQTLWFAPLFMDEISIDEDPHELSMLKLPDDVCQDVSQAVARRRNTGDRDHDVLSDVLKVVEVRGSSGQVPDA